MQRTFFALFEDVAEAEAALVELAADDRLRDRTSVIVHRDKLMPDNIKSTEADSRHGAVVGMAVGGIGGAIVAGLALGPAGLYGTGPLFSALAGLGGGGLFGALAGALSGAASPNHRLEELARRVEEGKILVTVEADGLDAEEEVERLFARHGAIEARRGLA